MADEPDLTPEFVRMRPSMSDFPLMDASLRGGHSFGGTVMTMSVMRRFGTAVIKGVLATQVWIYRRTKGRRAASMRGTPVLLLTTTGRRSGERRTRPVGYLPAGERFLVCGSNGGSESRTRLVVEASKASDATVEVGDRTLSVAASEITGEEYEEAWAHYIAAYPSFSGYRAKTQRHLPMYVLQERVE